MSRQMKLQNEWFILHSQLRVEGGVDGSSSTDTGYNAMLPPATAGS